MREPYPYQKAILNKIYPQDRVALFVDMRLGKTLTILRWLKHKNPKTTLVVTPLSIIDTWKKELEMENVPVFEFRTFRKEVIPFLQAFSGVVLTNYESLLYSELATKVNWDCVILDESQKIRRSSAKISSLCSDVFKDVKYRAILTGTPAPESPIDYFNQFKFLHGEMCGQDNLWDFRYRNFVLYGTKFVPTPGGINNIKGELINKAIIVSRRNPAVQEIFKNEKIYQQRFVQFDKEAQTIYNKMESEWMIGVDEEQLSAKFAIVVQNYLHQMAGGYLKKLESFVCQHKLNELETIVNDELSHDDKVVIFAKHRKEIESICETLKGAIPIYGEVPPESRAQRIKFWTEQKLKDGKLRDRFLVCQIATASMGINLSAADTAIYYSNSWALQDRLQSEDRILSKENSTLLYIDLLTKNSIDEDIANALEMKRQGQNIDFFKQIWQNFSKRKSLVRRKNKVSA